MMVTKYLTHVGYKTYVKTSVAAKKNLSRRTSSPPWRLGGQDTQTQMLIQISIKCTLEYLHPSAYPHIVYTLPSYWCCTKLMAWLETERTVDEEDLRRKNATNSGRNHYVCGLAQKVIATCVFMRVCCSSDT